MEASDPTSLSMVVQAVLTWIAVGIIRKVSPSFWEDLDKQKFRLVIVAISAVVISVVYGLVGGLAWPAIAKSALAAFLGAIGLREWTKAETQQDLPNLSRKSSLKTHL